MFLQRQFVCSRLGSVCRVFLISFLYVNELISQSTGKFVFDVASIKPVGSLNSGSSNPRMMDSEGVGELHARSMSLIVMIGEAYGVRIPQIVGGPLWVKSDWYDINAKSQISSSEKLVPKNRDRSSGPLGTRWSPDIYLRLQSLLEDRVHLKFHRENWETRVYKLVIAKGGPKVSPSNCVGVDLTHPPSLLPPNYCGEAKLVRNGAEAIYQGTDWLLAS